MLDRLTGVWRIQRNNQRGQRHTITCTVALVHTGETRIDVDERDVRVDTYRASGAGGQHRNKTDSAVRLTHLPTGMVVCSAEERSQWENRQRAWTELRRRLATNAHAAAHAAVNGARTAQIERGARTGDGRDWTWNEKAGRVTRQADGRSWPIDRFETGRIDLD